MTAAASVHLEGDRLRSKRPNLRGRRACRHPEGLHQRELHQSPGKGRHLKMGGGVERVRRWASDKEKTERSPPQSYFREGGSRQRITKEIGGEKAKGLVLMEGALRIRKINWIQCQGGSATLHQVVDGRGRLVTDSGKSKRKKVVKKKRITRQEDGRARNFWLTVQLKTTENRRRGGVLPSRG